MAEHPGRTRSSHALSGSSPSTTFTGESRIELNLEILKTEFSHFRQRERTLNPKRERKNNTKELKKCFSTKSHWLGRFFFAVFMCYRLFAELFFSSPGRRRLLATPERSAVRSAKFLNFSNLLESAFKHRRGFILKAEKNFLDALWIAGTCRLVFSIGPSKCPS